MYILIIKEKNINCGFFFYRIYQTLNLILIFLHDRILFFILEYYKCELYNNTYSVIKFNRL